MFGQLLRCAVQRHNCEALCGLMSPHEKMDDETAFFVREECSIVQEAVFEGWSIACRGTRANPGLGAHSNLHAQGVI